MNFNAEYDVINSANGYYCGTWSRRGAQSVLRGSWALFRNERQIASLLEDSAELAAVRRFVHYGQFIPVKYFLRTGSGELIATYGRSVLENGFALSVVNHVPDDESMERLVAAGGILLASDLQGGI